jgi:hypothetical protein
MIRILKSGLALALALAAVTTAANAFDLKGGGQVKLKTTKVQLGIISPDNCPGKGTLQAWIFTNKPGTVNIMIVEKGGDVAGPYQVTTVSGSGGTVLGSYKQNLMIQNPIDSEYRVVVVGSDLHSNWVPLTACL